MHLEQYSFLHFTQRAIAGSVQCDVVKQGMEPSASAAGLIGTLIFGTETFAWAESNSNSTSPSFKIWPEVSLDSLIDSSLIKVPLVEPQSRTRITPSSSQSITQCCEEMVGCSTWKVLPKTLPTLLMPRRRSKKSSESIPDLQISLGMMLRRRCALNPLFSAFS